MNSQTTQELLDELVERFSNTPGSIDIVTPLAIWADKLSRQEQMLEADTIVMEAKARALADERAELEQRALSLFAERSNFHTAIAATVPAAMRLQIKNWNRENAMKEESDDIPHQN